MKITHYVGWWVQEARPEGTIGGSYHIIEIETQGKKYKMLMDIGNQPSNAAATAMDNPFMHMDVNSFDLAFISHVHQDHIGNCIRLVKAWYKGPIYMSEMSKFLAKAIFEDALKHEKEEVEEYNRKIEKLQQELHDAWYTAHESHGEQKNQHKGWYFSVEKMYEQKINDILWDFAIKKTKYRKRLKETLLDKDIDDKEIMGIVHEVPVHQNKSEESFIDRCLALKRQIMDSQHNFHGLRDADATHKLNKYKINSKADIYDLSNDLAIMEFDENDVLQVLQQIQAVPMKEKTAVIPGVLTLTLYTAGHIEGATQSVWQVLGEWNETKTFMYTGDIGRTKQPSLTGKPDLPTETMDYVITEGTYAGRTHQDRDGEIKKIIHDIGAAKDICIVPVFALQRFQDVLSILVDAVHKGALKLTEWEKIYCHTPLGYVLTKEYLLQDKQGRYKNLNDRDIVEWIEWTQEVVNLLKKKGRKIIMCSGGMLERGTVMQYIDKVNNNKDASIILTGFQVPGTNGYKILHGEFEEPVYLNNKLVKSNEAYIGNYPLSGHADHEELLSYLTHLHYGKDAKVTIVHGGPARHTLAQDVKTTKPEITINVPDENGITFEM